jgi:hypothetical protein
MQRISETVGYYTCLMEIFTSAALVVFAIAFGVGLLVFGIRGTRESKARDGRTYKRGRI